MVWISQAFKEVILIKCKLLYYPTRDKNEVLNCWRCQLFNFASNFLLIPYNEQSDLSSGFFFLFCCVVLKLNFSWTKRSANQEGNMSNCMWSAYFVFSYNYDICVQPLLSQPCRDRVLCKESKFPTQVWRFKSIILVSVPGDSLVASWLPYNM